ncbi:MAG: iron-sulfur cluster assembly scaffold protein [bacterium]|nr:iron-sulfur cluster assembly scaffold protein [bacterium]
MKKFSVKELFLSPQNCGKIEDPDGFGIYGDSECGDYVEVYLKIEDEHITDIKFLCKGCPTAIALTSLMTILAKGKHVDDAAEITDEVILDSLEGEISEEKKHCSNLGAEALYNALMNYVLKDIES